MSFKSVTVILLNVPLRSRKALSADFAGSESPMVVLSLMMISLIVKAAVVIYPWMRNIFAYLMLQPPLKVMF